MQGIKGIVYFDGSKDYVFSLREPLHENTLSVCDTFDTFKKKSLKMIQRARGIRLVRLPTEDIQDSTIQQFTQSMADSVPELRVVQGERTIEQLVEKHGLTAIECMPFTLGPKSMYPAHVHTKTTEAFYVEQGVVIAGDDIYYEGDCACFTPGEPHHYRNPTTTNTELFLVFSPAYNPQDFQETGLKEKELDVQEMTSFMLSRTDAPLFGVRAEGELRYALFLQKEYGEQGPIALMDDILAKSSGDLEPIVLDEASGQFSAPRQPEKSPDELAREVNYTNSVYFAGSLQDLSYLTSIYQLFDKIPRMILLYPTPEAEEYIRIAEIAGDYIVQLRDMSEQNGEKPITSVFVESKTSQNTHLKYKDRILERCRERGIPVSDIVYKEGDEDFSLNKDGITAVFVDCLDRLSLVRDIRERFGQNARLLFRAFNPMVLNYYETGISS